VIKPYDLLNGVLHEIENGLRKGVNENTLAKKFFLSNIYLRKLFKFAFGQPIGTYIRLRKLSSSIEDLLNTNRKILDIALEYGLDYEQSYIRTFKREFGITPGDLRKTGQIIKITPPLQLFDSNKLADGLLFGPEIVMIPQFHVVGKRHKLPLRDVLDLAASMAKHFYNHDRLKISNAVNPAVLIILCRQAGTDADYGWFMPSIQVKMTDNVPEGFDCDTFPSSLCAKFRFIGSSDNEINTVVADGMFKAIDNFMDNKKQKYFLERKKVTIDRFVSSAFEGIFSQREWFAPVTEKTKNGVFNNPDKIVKTYKHDVPALRFIGKKYSHNKNQEEVFDKILENMDNWCWNHAFNVIERQSDTDLKTFYEGGDSFAGLIRKKDGVIFEYWLGIFMPEGTNLPAGYEMIDFPKSKLGVCRVYGKRNSIIHYDADCRKKLAEEGIECHKKWFFLRFNWRGFFEEDKFGKRLLDYCYYL
jgi:AraC family transcriptional regulator